MLARLWKQPYLEADTVQRPVPPSSAAHHCPQSLSSTPASNRSRKRRQKPVRVCRLYPTPPSPSLAHARALLVFIQDECPEFVGAYVPRPDLERFYRHDVCTREGWAPLHWTGIARQLGRLTERKTIRHKGERFVGYRIPKRMMCDGQKYGQPTQTAKNRNHFNGR